MNLLEQSVARAVQTNFKMNYDFKIRFRAPAGINMPPPPDIDIFAKELSYGPTEIEMDQIKIGSRILTVPVSSQPVTTTLTLRDTKSEMVAKWLDSIAGRMINADGTQNAPFDPQSGWILILDRYRLIYNSEDDIKEELASSIEVAFSQRGDVTETRGEIGFLTYPATFIQFRS